MSRRCLTDPQYQAGFPKAAKRLQNKGLTNFGVTFTLGTKPSAFSNDGDQLCAELDGVTTLRASRVQNATGRDPNLGASAD